MLDYKFICPSLEYVREDKKIYKNYIQMDAIMKRLFSLKNPKPIIDFLNAIYDDNIGYDAKISYGGNCIITFWLSFHH
ncbi:MAG: hypothetical protein ACERKV_13930 [Clostridiaceae bacterium]